jgi:hypothetical protein
MEARKVLLGVFRERIKSAYPGLESNLILDKAGTFSFQVNRPEEGNVIDDLRVFEGIPLVHLTLRESRVGDLSPLNGMPLEVLVLVRCDHVQDLSPLRGMPLEVLELTGCIRVEDITPLTGLQLHDLNINRTPVRDLKPLAGMPLRRLNIGSSLHSRDLSPLRGMPLEYLSLNASPQTDLTPLEGMELNYIYLPKSGLETKGVEVLRPMQSLTTIERTYGRNETVEEFWQKYDQWKRTGKVPK